MLNKIQSFYNQFYRRALKETSGFIREFHVNLNLILSEYVVTEWNKCLEFCGECKTETESKS